MKMTKKQKKQFEQLVEDYMLDYGCEREVAEDMARESFGL